MLKRLLSLMFAGVIILTAASAARAQTPAASGGDTGWKVTLYPVFVWVPLGIDINIDVPPIDVGGGGGTGGGRDIIDGRFDGAFMGGFNMSKGIWRIDFDGLWAAVGGDRPANPKFSVDVDAIYWHGTTGIKVYKDLFITAGVRRYALKYVVKLTDYPDFERKPGLWDPIVGLAWHHVGNKLETHAVFEAGGFGVGADVDASASARVDWKPVSHFGLTAGYTYLYFKASNTVRERTFTFKQTLHGPIIGIGFYF